MKGEIGLGDPNSRLKVYMGNMPPIEPYLHLETVRAVTEGEIQQIGQLCGNGWRKVFNVYAKFLFALNGDDFAYSRLSHRWQDFRDQYLLRADSDTALIFSAPDLPAKTSEIRIVMGRTYAMSLAHSPDVTWLSREFAWSPNDRYIVCPYFDYRQLSNQKIEILTRLVAQLP